MTQLEVNHEPLPPLYAGWISELLGGNPIPSEGRATCDNCAMLPPAGESRVSSSHYFKPETKCCTYLPALPNFLVGRILEDDDPAAGYGRATTLKRLEDGVAVTPLGLGQSPVFALLYHHSDESVFGRTRTLRCPHYIEEGGRCGIWRHRHSVCATWFCKHERGNVGFAFWRESLLPLLWELEKSLSHWCVLKLDLGSDALKYLFEQSDDSFEPTDLSASALDREVDRDAYQRLWGDWPGREKDFFIECSRLVNALSWEEVLNTCGANARVRARITEDAYRRLLSDEIPAELKVGPMQLVQIRPGLNRLTTYSHYDPVDIPSELLELLPYFNGRSTSEALNTIRNEKGLTLEPTLVRKMVDFALLVPATKTTNSQTAK